MNGKIDVWRSISKYLIQAWKSLQDGRTAWGFKPSRQVDADASSCKQMLNYYQQETKRWRSRLPLAGTVTLGQKCSCYNTDGLPAKHDLPCVSDCALLKVKSNREQMYRRIHSPYWKGVFKNKLTFNSIGLPSKKKKFIYCKLIINSRKRN